MAQRQYTFMFAPGSSARLMRLKLSRRSAHAVAVLAGLVVLSAVLLPFVGYNAISKSRQLSQLRAETESLKAEAATIQTLRQQVALFEKRASQLALMAGVGSLNMDHQQMAPPSSQAAMDQSGSDEPLAMAPGAPEPPETTDTTKAPTKALGDLSSRSSILIKSFDELDRAYESRSQELSTTPSISPARGLFGGGFAYRKDPFTGMRAFHGGLDIVAPEGSPIRAPADGRVIFAGQEHGFGNAVYIAHGRGLTTRYAHMERITARVGDRVVRGDIIGYVGDTGRSLGAHLHYEVLINNVRVDPARYILDDAVSY